MDKFPQMLYLAPGPEPIHGGHFATLVVNDETEHAHAIADGWSESTTDAKETHEAAQRAALVGGQDGTSAKAADDAPPTRDELEAKANELGIKFDGRWGDKKLGEAIAAKLAE